MNLPSSEKILIVYLLSETYIFPLLSFTFQTFPITDSAFVSRRTYFMSEAISLKLTTLPFPTADSTSIKPLRELSLFELQEITAQQIAVTVIIRGH